MREPFARIKYSAIKSFIIVLLILSTHIAWGSELFQEHRFGKQSSVLVTCADNTEIYAWQADKPLIPASTQKLITAMLAIDQWGLDHRFHTDVFIDKGWLWVKGYGDPFLVSEELDRIATALASRLKERSVTIKGIGVDASFFGDTIVPGRSKTNDPYNAPLSAVAANFNTVYLHKQGAKILTAESQTPLTPTAITFAQNLKSGKHRVNLRDTRRGQQHFAELLRLKLVERGVSGKIDLRFGIVPPESRLFYTHYNSITLSHVLKGFLTYSNNFVANQLFILLGDNSDTSSLSLRSSVVEVKKQLISLYSEEAGDAWERLQIDEGAGLSRGNRLSARQLLQVLEDFEPYQHLLRPYVGKKARAKTGNLKGVKTFAGYLNVKGETYYFVFLFNDPVPYGYRQTLLKELQKFLI